MVVLDVHGPERVAAGRRAGRCLHGALGLGAGQGAALSGRATYELATFAAVHGARPRRHAALEGRHAGVAIFTPVLRPAVGAVVGAVAAHEVDVQVGGMVEGAEGGALDRLLLLLVAGEEVGEALRQGQEALAQPFAARAAVGGAPPIA